MRVTGFIWDDEDDDRGNVAHITRQPVSEAPRGVTMHRRKRIPAAEFWATHDSAPYASGLKEERVRVSAGLRQRVSERATAMKAVTLRLEDQQIARAKEVARRKSVPYQTLMRMWIAEGLARESPRPA